MRIDEDLVSLLQDFVKFLESMCEMKLPDDVENRRKDILQRSKKYLEINNEELSSSSAYLNMCAGKGKGLVMANNDKSITEYIDPENQPAESSTPTSQGYYECFPEMKKSSSNLSQKNEINSDNILVDIYSSFSAELTKNKCYKCGPLLQKEERKFIGFNFEHFRSCWVGLVGTHLLVYSSKTEKQPSDVYSIRGYSSRASPNVTPRDPERGKSAFEVFSPGDKTRVFIAESPSDMEQWITAICRLGCNQSESSTVDNLIETIPSLDGKLNSPEEEQYQDVGSIDDNKSLREKKHSKEIKISFDDKIQTENLYTNEKLNIEKLVDNPPALPARIPRRLPSLPHENATSYEPLENGCDEDDIYHKIEDFKKPTASTYQNSNKSDSTSVFSSSSEQDTYDDVQNSSLKKVNLKKNTDEEVACYDDIDQIEGKNKKILETTSKKKSLFSRMKKDSDSPNKQKKSSKKMKKSKIKKSEMVVEEILQHELQTYDDVSDVKIDENCEKINRDCEKINGDCERIIYDDEQANYICPPAPRPIHVKSESEKHDEEVYDDIGEIKKSEIVESPLIKGEFLMSHEVEEHYQVPRSSESIDQGQLTTTIEEELYDDIAILTEFRARQRDLESSSSSSSLEKTGNNVVKVWNRFASGRKFKSSDNNLMEKFDSKKSSDDKSTEKNGESEEENDAFKLNKFQKLINKMEYSLSKTKQLSIVHKSHNDLGK